MKLGAARSSASRRPVRPIPNRTSAKLPLGRQLRPPGHAKPGLNVRLTIGYGFLNSLRRTPPGLRPDFPYVTLLRERER